MNSNQTLNSTIQSGTYLERQASLCQALTHPFRLKLIKILENGPKKVGDIEFETKRPQPFISQHLRVLREKGVVLCEKNAQEVYYSLADHKILEVCKLIAELTPKQVNNQG